MSELFDVYDEALNHIGVKARAAVHRDGDWHQVFHCWVIGRDADGGSFVILQKRAPNKDYPGKIDISAAGHLEAGETVRDGVREIEEELGLQVGFEDLIPLGRRLGIMKDGDLHRLPDLSCLSLRVQSAAGGISLFPRRDCRLADNCRLDDGRRSVYRRRVASAKAIAIGLGANEIDITVDDFIPSIDNYILKAVIPGAALFRGRETFVDLAERATR